MDDFSDPNTSSADEQQWETEFESPSSNLTPAKKRKRSKQIQGFVDSWLSEPQFKSWLTKKIGNGKKAQPFCKTCSKFVTCSKTGLKRHQTSTYHKRCHDASIGSTSTIPSLFNQPTIRDATSSMEIKMCAFISEHNLPISIADAFVEFLRSLFPNDDVLRKVRLGKQKATNVIRQVIGFDYLYEAVSALQSHRFSIIIDETTEYRKATCRFSNLLRHAKF